MRQRILRVSRVSEAHRFILLGRPLNGISARTPLVGPYLKLKDLEFAERSRAKRRNPKSDALSVGRVTLDDPELAQQYYLKPDRPTRLSVDELCTELEHYDIISFDIFDTALFRTIESPSDVFRILGHKLRVDGFSRLRKDAEAHARATSDQLRGTREVVLSDIYAVMAQRYGAEPSWEALEGAIEIELSRPNPHIKAVFDRMRQLGKRIVFMSDMYLPRPVLEAMLSRNGYGGYEKLYLSNEHAKRKGDGTLQRLLLDDYGKDHSIVHVGDVMDADVLKSQAAGLPAVYNADQRALIRERDMGSLAGSFYSAVINNHIGSGTWAKSLHYTHGFRVGGILAVGYCEFLDRLAREKSIDKILFCGRDCDVISEVYQQHYGDIPNEYIDVSRYALLGITLDRNYQEYIDRSFFRWLGQSNNSRTLAQVLADTGFDYLIPYLENADIEQFLFPSGGLPSAIRRRLQRFFWDHRQVVVAHNETSRAAAKEYFSQIIGDAQRILVVDIGWAGTSATVLREFFRRSLPDAGLEVFGALMCASRTEAVTDAVSTGFLSTYVHSALENMDLTKFMMPWGRHPVRTTDLLHHPLEYLFTEDQATVTGYGFDEEHSPVVLRGNNRPQNHEQIRQMQAGILDFATAYLEYSADYAAIRPVSAYVAFTPLKNAIEHAQYCYLVYRDFLYDAAPTLFADAAHYERFGELYELVEGPPRAIEGAASGAGESTGMGRILFISPEMIHAGAPRSLLRLCKVASSLGYEPIVWTAKAGPFASEFEAQGFSVQVVDARDITEARIGSLIESGVRLVVSNTVVTDAYVRRLEGRLPVVWYVREATNLPDFLRSSPERAETLRRSASICCVSDYAASAIAHFADGPIEVVKNSVEDVSALALPYEYSRHRKHKFVQLGTIEQRKGYDVFVAAYKSLPEKYRDRAELHFAGGFISSGTSFASYLFGRLQDEEGIHFHGLIADERSKIELLSQMDTVVVASRDESCSLVALEGAMLSRPLIVTQNVGAKYMVSDENGLIVDSGSVASLRDAFIAMMDADEESVRSMGAASRTKYEALASMEAHRRDLAQLFSRRIAAGPGKEIPVASNRARSATVVTTKDDRRELIVSLTSFPRRISSLAPCIDSLQTQSLSADRIILWLSVDQFPRKEADLPTDLLDRVGERFRIAWVDGDLGPHKKYFYAMQEYPGAVIVTVDDDAIYNRDLLRNLHEGYLENPHAVICDRANLVLFRPDGELREYDGWAYDHNQLRGTPTYQLLPTGVGGVLYPPKSVPKSGFDITAIANTSLFADDLWLKVMTAANGYPVWMPRQRSGYQLIQEAQSAALWRANSFQSQNDAALQRVLDHFGSEIGSREALLRRIRGVGDEGEFFGPRTADTASLI